jgi:hypothetical protein
VRLRASTELMSDFGAPAGTNAFKSLRQESVSDTFSDKFDTFIRHLVSIGSSKNYFMRSNKSHREPQGSDGVVFGGP